MGSPRWLLVTVLPALQLAACAGSGASAETPGAAPSTSAGGSHTAAPSQAPASTATAMSTTASTATSRPLADAFYWTRSPEYAALASQIYARAQAILPAALADSGWTAELSPSPDEASQPPAIILDVDETVLDNSVYQRELARAGAGFDVESWRAFCLRRASLAVPGAAELVAAAQQQGVAVMLITNRDHTLRRATLDNLAKVGIHLGTADRLMLLGEAPDWGRDKTHRRALVQDAHRVLLMFGDNMDDFVVFHGDPSQRIERYRAQLSDRWFLLPNPYYGPWVSRARE